MGTTPRGGGRGGAAGQLERLVISLLRFDRLWWWLAVVAAVALLGQEIAKSSAFVVAAEFEGFDNELDEEVEDESNTPFVVPPPVQPMRGFQNDRGPPAPKSPAPAVEQNQKKQWDEADAGEVEVKEAVEEPRAKGIPFNEKLRAADSKFRLEQIWDEDEFEGLPVENVDDHVVISGNEKASSAKPTATKRPPPPPRGPEHYYIEAVSILFMIAYGVVYYYGRKENEKIALSWAAQYCGKDSVMEKNFSLLGTGDGIDSPLLMKEGQNIFKFYASGRRYCEGLLATMDFQSRHDLIARLWYLVQPRKDEITIEVFMNDENMDPIVLALARKKHAKVLQKDTKDLNQFASILSPPSQRKWVTDELVAISESRELANDLLTDALVDQVFGEKAFEKYSSNFVSLHFTDQNPYGSHKKILQFKFTMPAIDRMQEIARLVSVVTYFIDAVGRYKLSPQAKAKADSARAKIAQELFKENQGARQETLLRKKEERRKALEDAESSKITPEGLRKREERERVRQMKKNMPKVKMTRAH